MNNARFFDIMFWRFMLPALGFVVFWWQVDCANPVGALSMLAGCMVLSYYGQIRPC